MSIVDVAGNPTAGAIVLGLFLALLAGVLNGSWNASFNPELNLAVGPVNSDSSTQDDYEDEDDVTAVHNNRLGKNREDGHGYVTNGRHDDSDSYPMNVTKENENAENGKCEEGYTAEIRQTHNEPANAIQLRMCE